MFDFESNCVQEASLKDTDTTEWNGKHIRISVSISSNLVKEPISLFNCDLPHLVTPLIGALEISALQSRTIMKNLFFDIETTKKSELDTVLEKLTQCHIQRDQADLLSCTFCDNDTCTSTQIFQIQKKQLFHLPEHLERFCKVLSIFGFNSAMYHLNLRKSYSLPIRAY